MKYLLTIYGDESGWDDATPEQVAADHGRVRGVRRGGRRRPA